MAENNIIKSKQVKEAPPKGRRLKGFVVSDKMSKTVVVEVMRLKMNSKYKKYYKVSRRYKAHDPENQFKTGDKVVIKEVRPISKDKRWTVIEKLD